MSKLFTYESSTKIAPGTGSHRFFSATGQSRFGNERLPLRTLVPSNRGPVMGLEKQQKAFQVMKGRVARAADKAQAYTTMTEKLPGSRLPNLDGYQLFLGGAILIFVFVMMTKSH